MLLFLYTGVKIPLRRKAIFFSSLNGKQETAQAPIRINLNDEQLQIFLNDWSNPKIGTSTIYING